MRKIISFLAGLLAGAIIGVVVATLLAPFSGSELQGRIRARIQELIEEGKRAAAAHRAELEAQLDNFKRGAPITIGTTPKPPQA